MRTGWEQPAVDVRARTTAFCFTAQKATMFVDRGRYEIYPEKGKG